MIIIPIDCVKRHQTSTKWLNILAIERRKIRTCYEYICMVPDKENAWSSASIALDLMHFLFQCRSLILTSNAIVDSLALKSLNWMNVFTILLRGVSSSWLNEMLSKATKRWAFWKIISIILRCVFVVFYKKTQHSFDMMCIFIAWVHSCPFKRCSRPFSMLSRRTNERDSERDSKGKHNSYIHSREIKAIYEQKGEPVKRHAHRCSKHQIECTDFDWRHRPPYS